MSIFDLMQEYQIQVAEKKVGGYSTETLRSDLLKVYVPVKRKRKKKTTGKGTLLDEEISSRMISYLRNIRSRCANLFPSCKNINLKEMEPTEKFQYLKFFYYMGKAYSEWREDGYNLFDCLNNPSERHQQEYIKMLKEIWDNKEKVSLNPQVAEEIWGHDGQGYGDSLHSVQQWISGIAYGLYHDYGDAIGPLRENAQKFNRVLDEYIEKSAHLDRGFGFKLSCWDELCLLLAYNRDWYWEKDLLEAHRTVYGILNNVNVRVLNPETQLLLTPQKLFYPHDQDYILGYQDGKIKEFTSRESYYDKGTPCNASEEHLDALECYIKEHIGELAIRIFSPMSPEKGQKARIINHFPDFKAYWEMERRRYGRNSILTRSKLIAAYQVIFMALPSSGIGFSKPKTPKMREGNKSYRENKSLSSTYKNSSQKDPFYQQLICVWTDIQLLRCALPPQFKQELSNLYSEINIKALEALTTIDRLSRPAAIQASAESILLLTAETLTPVEDDKEEIPALVRHLYPYLGSAKNIPSTSLTQLHRLGAYCRLFAVKDIAELIKERIRELKYPKEKFSVSLGKASVDAVLFQDLTLEIDYDPEHNFYTLSSFPSHSIENLLSEEKRVCQNRKSAAGS